MASCRVSAERVSATPDVILRYYTFGSGNPSVLIVAGIHGDELTSIFAALRLVKLLKSSASGVRGTITILPKANPLAIKERKRTAFDGIDLNRCFPGDKNGMLTERIAERIWNIAVNQDYVLDLHCCGHCSAYVLALHMENRFIREYAEKIPLDTVVQSTGLRKQLFVELTHAGVPAAIIEVPGISGIANLAWSRKLSKVVLQLLVNIGALNGKPRKVRQRYFSKLVSVVAQKEGVFVPRSELGMFVRKGWILGYIVDEEGELPTRIPCSGKLMLLRPPSYCCKGEELARIAPPI